MMQRHKRPLENPGSLVLFIALTLGGGLAIGYATAPGEWYEALAKPSFNPPAWLFAPVWTVLYAAISVAGWRAWIHDRRGRLIGLWWAQLALNFAWSPIFFTARRVGLALAVITLLFVTIAAFILTAWKRDRIAAWPMLPYAIWVAFASVLNAALFLLNR
jgi:translocator protein